MARPLPIGSVAGANSRCPPPTTRIRRPRRPPRPSASPRDSSDSGRGSLAIWFIVSSQPDGGLGHGLPEFRIVPVHDGGAPRLHLAEAPEDGQRGSLVGDH